jgi:uncharacterized membrane protein YphA (DoxX/SURF4 family)
LPRIFRFLFDNPYLSFILRLALGGVFIYASLDKIAHPAAFAQAIANYRLLPSPLVNIPAIALPWIEIIAGVLLILGVFIPGISLVFLAMLIVFLGAMYSTIVRGLDISCGCFTTAPTAERIDFSYLLRDFLCLLAAVQVYVSPRSWAALSSLFARRRPPP